MLGYSCQEKVSKIPHLTPTAYNEQIAMLDYVTDLEYISIDAELLINGEILDLIYFDSTYFFTTFSRDTLYILQSGPNGLQAVNLAYDTAVPKRIGNEGPLFDITYNPETKMVYVSDNDQNIYGIDSRSWIVTDLIRGHYAHNMLWKDDHLMLNNYAEESPLLALNVDTKKNWLQPYA